MSEVPQIGNADLAHMIQKARAAPNGSFGVLSTGEKLIAALLLNRPDWLAEMDYTMADAIERVGADWLRLIPAAARQLRDEIREAAHADAIKAREAKLTGLSEGRATDDPAEFAATLVTWGHSPGYREVDLVFDLAPAYQESSLPSFRASIRISPADGEAIVRHIRDVHRFAWGGSEPIDVRPGEKRPTWI
ncbi:hypothetical protein KXS07_31465 [Inquilinus limosus]|uniref:hypothetical protein n=1 Tax=Inquilinus limosus TaxID=171674 RepID=UPI003F1505DE